MRREAVAGRVLTSMVVSICAAAALLVTGCGSPQATSTSPTPSSVSPVEEAPAGGQVTSSASVIRIQPTGRRVLGMRFSTYGCLLLDANDVVIPADSEFIAGPGSNLGNTLVQCSATVENPTGRTIIYSGGGGVTCFGYGQETVRWRQVITPNGRAQLTCNIPD